MRLSAQLSILLLVNLSATGLMAKETPNCRSLISPAPAARVEAQAEPTPIKPELALMELALSKHFNKKEYSLQATQAAMIEYVEILDPHEIFLTEEIANYLSHLNQKDLQMVHGEVFTSPDRTFYSGVLNIMIKNVNHVVQKFANDQDFRDRVFIRVDELRELVKAKKTKQLERPGRPHNTEEMESQFIDVFAFKILNSKRSDREAFVLAIREVRAWVNQMSAEINLRMLPTLVAKSYIATLDPHSDLQLPKASRHMKHRMSSDMVGIGVNFVADVKGIRIARIIPGGAAEQAGLKENDIITHVTSEAIQVAQRKRDKKSDWIMLRNVNFEDSGMYIGGEEGSTANLTVSRGKETLQVAVIREKMSLANSKMKIDVVNSPNGKVARIQFDVFYNGAGEDMREALQEVLAQNKITGVALDLRRNGGGSINEIPAVLSIFMPENPVFASVDNQGQVEQVLSIDPAMPVLWDGPMIVMTDAFSASASEAVSGTLQDYGRAIVVGQESSYGKGSMQRINGIGKSGLSMRLTSSLFFTPSGRTPQATGILSDVVLKEVQRPATYEREYTHVIPEQRIESFMPGQQPMIPNKTEIITQLNKKSKARQAQAIGEKSAAQLFEENTSESLQVLSDLVEAI